MKRTRRATLGLCAGGIAGLTGCGSDTGTTAEGEPTPTDTEGLTTDAQPPRTTVPPAREPDLGGYLDDAMGYDGSIVDARGAETTTVAVGAGRIGYAFVPAALWVDTGATVLWEWTGEGGDHNVVAEDDTFDSGQIVGEEGATYEYTFEESGIYTYYCEPHLRQGMKGVVVVGDQ